VPGRRLRGLTSISVGFIGPYKLPPYYIDRLEVTNRDYQKFVDSGGYEKKEYWTEKFIRDGHELSWAEAMASFATRPTGLGRPDGSRDIMPRDRQIFPSPA
jgi:formylglycine-generating enzyme required for sulfatase activity